MQKIERFILSLACLACTLAGSASAGLIVTFDELGNGSVKNTISGQVTTLVRIKDPLTGGNPKDPMDNTGARPLTYDLASNLLVGQNPTFGDVVVQESGGQVQDLLRFDNRGFLLVYSESVEGDLSLADVGVTSTRQANPRTITELGPEGGINGVMNYQPIMSMMTGDKDPGFLPDNPGPVTYNFFSDGTVPEPSAIVLLPTVLVLLGLARHQRIRPPHRVRQ